MMSHNALKGYMVKGLPQKYDSPLRIENRDGRDYFAFDTIPACFITMLLAAHAAPEQRLRAVCARGAPSRRQEVYSPFVGVVSPL